MYTQEKHETFIFLSHVIERNNFILKMGCCVSLKSSSKQFKMHFFLHQRSAFELLSRLNYLAYVWREIFPNESKNQRFKIEKWRNNKMRWDARCQDVAEADRDFKS